MEADKRVALDRKKVLGKLEDLAGKRFTEDDITFAGSALVVPETMSANRAVKVLSAHIEQQETETSFNRTFQYRPWDGAAAFERAVKKLTGTVGIQQGSFSFFGSSPPARITVHVDVDESIDVPWGSVYIELFEGNANLGMTTHPEYGALFKIDVTCPRKYRGAVEGLFQIIEVELNERSIYRGKAFDGQPMPEFVDLSGVDPKQVVYSGDVSQQLHANLWSLLEHGDAMRELGVPLKRSVLLHGPYGTGKTLAAFLTALKAVENGWTFVYCRPGKDNLQEVMQTARLYQPSVVFFEDVDSVSDGTKVVNGGDAVSMLLDAFDGITAKGTELVAVLTTNHPERIHKGMVRPGRLDAVIEIGALDHAGVESMVTAVVPDELLGDIDHEAVGVSMEGFMPAFVKEAIDRAMRYAIARTGGKPDVLETDDFVLAATGLRPQLEMMNSALEGVHRDTLSDAMRSEVTAALGEAVFEYDSDTNTFQVSADG